MMLPSRVAPSQVVPENVRVEPAKSSNALDISSAMHTYALHTMEGSAAMIGKFEELTLLTLLKVGPDAHAAKVYAAMEEQLDKVPKFAALYTALDRMTKKRLVKERQSGARDGRPKRLFTITGEGRRALDEAVNATRQLMDFVPRGGARSHA